VDNSDSVNNLSKHPTTMASINPRLSTILFAFSYLVLSTSAQNGTNSTETCGSNFPTPINGTGSAEVSDDLYVSLTFGDIRSGKQMSNINFQPWKYGYISAPRNSSAQACVYMFNTAEAQEGDDNNGCSGVLSQICISYLQRELRIAASTEGTGSGQTVQCPQNPPITSAEFVNACGPSAKGWGSTVITTRMSSTHHPR
jgi:hypothetical protein